jgi:hypothetical protein
MQAGLIAFQRLRIPTKAATDSNLMAARLASSRGQF